MDSAGNGGVGLGGEQHKKRDDVVFYPDPILRAKAVDLTPEEISSPETLEIIRDMIEIMKKRHGVGIAANQIGLDKNICVCWLNNQDETDILPMINPRLTDCSKTMSSYMEGCLSFPGVGVNVKRPTWGFVEWVDWDGFPDSQMFRGFNARIVQHELDHLSGVRIIDKANTADKAASKRHLEELQLRAGVLPKSLRRTGYRLRG